MEMIKRFFKDESGATMVEYAIMVALIAIVAIVIIGAVGRQTRNAFQAVCLALNPTAECAIE